MFACCVVVSTTTSVLGFYSETWCKVLIILLPILLGLLLLCLIAAGAFLIFRKVKSADAQVPPSNLEEGEAQPKPDNANGPQKTEQKPENDSPKKPENKDNPKKPEKNEEPKKPEKNDGPKKSEKANPKQGQGKGYGKNQVAPADTQKLAPPPAEYAV